MKSIYGIVVPVRNEKAVLPVTVRALMAATAGDNVRIVWVCNGCTDGSASLIRHLAGADAEVLEFSDPSKTAALQAGDDALGDLFPRLYLDADTRLRSGDPARLMRPLFAGEADLVAPARAFDAAGASRLSVAIGACWLALPHAGMTAFSSALGISAAGRVLWSTWPELTGDDVFVAATVPPQRRRIVPEAIATTSIPTSFFGWVRMRARWLTGEAELVRMGLAAPTAPGQKEALMRRMLMPQTAIGAWAFAAARLLAALAPASQGRVGWIPDRPNNRLEAQAGPQS